MDADAVLGYEGDPGGHPTPLYRARMMDEPVMPMFAVR